ncbi:acyltransferase family protein [Aeromonas hydrophila]
MTTPTSHLLHPKYRPDIDGLRAVAVLSVVAFHAFPAWMRGGFIGVDVFFVISGFLISTIIFENLDKGTFSFAEFYARRIKRIFPALLLVLIASFAFGWLALLADEYKQLSKHIAAGAGFVANFILWGEAGYFDNSAETKPLLHLWSLGIEEQFYIVWPLVLWLAWRKKFNLLTLTILVAFVSFYLNLRGIKKDVVATFYSPQTRFWELLSGSILAWFTLYKKNAFTNSKLRIDAWLSKIFYQESVENDGKTLSNVISLVGSLLLAYGFWKITKEVIFPGNWAVIPVLGAILIILAGPESWVNRKVLSNKIAVWFGLISFPLYLWHWPLLSFARIIESEVPGRAIRIAAVVLSILLAWLTYKLVERPVRLGKHSKVKVTALVVIMSIVCGFTVYTYQSNFISSRAAKLLNMSKQLGWRIPAGSIEQSKLCHEAFPERAKMTSKERDDNFCLLQNNSNPNVLLVGDSMNLSLFPGLTKFNDYNILVLSASAAAPFYNVRTTEFGDSIRINNYKLTNQALDYALNASDIKVVILASLASPSLALPDSEFKITDVLNPDIKDAHSIFTKSLRLTVKKLLDAGKDVIYILPNPSLSYDIKSCLGNIRPFRLPGSVLKECSQPASNYFKNQGGGVYREWVNSVLNDFPQVKVFDAALPFCDSDYCYGSKDGEILYRDSGHLSISGSNLVAPMLHDLIIKSLGH